MIDNINNKPAFNAAHKNLYSNQDKPVAYIIPIADDWKKAVGQIAPAVLFAIEKRAEDIAIQRHKDAMQHYINNEI